MKKMEAVEVKEAEKNNNCNSESGVCDKSNDIESNDVQQHIEAIMFEAEQHELAFVNDDFVISMDGEDVYSPHVDRETAMLWLKTKLEEITNCVC